jgi:methylmalonyl-CoA mutase
MTPEYGAATQLEKIDMLDFADVVALNKFDKRGAPMRCATCASRCSATGRPSIRRSTRCPSLARSPPSSTIRAPPRPLSGAPAPRREARCTGLRRQAPDLPTDASEKIHIIPPQRTRYLSEISEPSRRYNGWVEEQSRGRRQDLQRGASRARWRWTRRAASARCWRISSCRRARAAARRRGARRSRSGRPKREQYAGEEYVYEVRGRRSASPPRRVPVATRSCPRVALPKYRGRGDLLRWLLQENVPGRIPLHRRRLPVQARGRGPDPHVRRRGRPGAHQPALPLRLRLAAGGAPVDGLRLGHALRRTTRRAPGHLRQDRQLRRLDRHLDDAKKLYSGFDLCDPKTSVSMTINGPAPMLLAFFMNAAIDQQCEKYIRGARLEARSRRRSSAKLRRRAASARATRRPARGQRRPRARAAGHHRRPGAADADLRAASRPRRCKGARHGAGGHPQGGPGPEHLHLLHRVRPAHDGRHPAVLHRERVRNFYSVSISGYHIAEAGANPITPARLHAGQRLHLRRVLPRPRHAHRRLRAEPVVLLLQRHRPGVRGDRPGRAAHLGQGDARAYGANERAEAQVPHPDLGRSLHAQEIAFNDIRTTLQALYAIYDNCNSCTPTPTTRRSPRRPRRACAARWPSS